MISLFKNEKSRVEGDVIYNVVDLRGLSDDEKPTTLGVNSIDNGSTFMEIDTGDKYMYDLENTTWYKIESGSGGGGSMCKFDYIIPLGLYEDVSIGEITDEGVLSVLNEIKDNCKDSDGYLKPLSIGVYLSNDDQGMDGFGTVYSGYTYGVNNIYFNVRSHIDSEYRVLLTYDGTKWSSTSIYVG